MAAAGLENVESSEVERIVETIVGRQVLDDPFLEKHAASQLALLTDEAYRGPAGGREGENPNKAIVSELVKSGVSIEMCGRTMKERGWTDEDLEVEDDMYGEMWARGKSLAAVVGHQTHHRGQMTVLMRQAGLTVPGVYGPAREEWAAYGMPPQE